MSVVCVDGNPQACAMTVIPVSVSLGVSAGSGDLIIPCSGCRGVCVYGTSAINSARDVRTAGPAARIGSRRVG